ncbi:MAG TPA: two-component regulator propeller domain-containing protein [Hanamia sp.]|nr:two-component regulator propeller domain-containing protein [Hanamia sp.]
MYCFNFRIFKAALTVFLLTTFSSYGQLQKQLLLHHITEENGLSDNHVKCIYKDKNNFVWVGTLSGLNLIDGSTITTFRHQPGNSNSIIGNDILSITGDKDGCIWIGSSSGLNSLNPFTRQIKLYQLPQSAIGPTDVVNALATDKTGTVFIGTAGGLFLYDKRKFTSVILPAEKNNLQKNNTITSLEIDHNGLLWITTFNGLWSYNCTTHIITHEINKANDPYFADLFTKVIEDHEGKIWAGTWEKGLKKYDPATKKIIDYINGPSNITTIAEIKQSDMDHLIWVNGTLTAFDMKENKFINFSVPNISPSLTITEMYASRDNWLWIGSNEGLYIYNPSKALFKHHIFSSPVTNQNVALLQWKNKLLVSGSGNNFLKAYNQQLSLTDDYTNSKITKDVSCLSLTASGPENIVAGTSDGIADINLRTHKMEFHTLKFLSKTFKAGNFITDVFEDDKKNWWIFPWRNGIWITNSSQNKFEQIFTNFLIEDRKPKPLVIASAVEDKNHNMWFADYDEGIIFYNALLNKFSKPFKNQLGEKYTTGQIIYYNKYCYTFINTEVYMWHCDSARIHNITLPDSTDKAIVSMAIDSSGNIWMATRQGLVVYNTPSKIFVRFTTSDGLIKNDMDGSLCCLSNGEMIFGCREYITAFDPEKLLTSREDHPDIILTEMIAAGKSISFNPRKKMVFDHSVNNFIFKWTVTDYNDPLYNNFYYKIQGIDANWHYAGNRGEVEFANLSPGHYTLLLRGSNSNRVYARKILHLYFEIKPPFWNTLWFLLLCFLAVIGIFYSLYRYRLNEVLRIEKLRNKISRDLHDDIGSTLSSISILSEMALKKRKENQSSEIFHEIRQNTLSLMERMDDIVWSINPKNDSLQNLLIRIKDFASRLFEAKEINYNINIPPKASELQLPLEYRQNIYLILKEAINNIIKYAECNAAEINVIHTGSQLNILIADNGVGFNPLIKTSGNGLESMKKRAAQMKAHLTISSKSGEGTTIQLTVKIK